jgi:hypothetical protein
MDYVGGAVAGFLGVTDSRFQYVLDQVSEEDLAAAQTDLRLGRKEGTLLLEEIGAQQQSDSRNSGLEGGDAPSSRLADGSV